MPEGHYDWKPHEKSMPLGYLAELIARMPSWCVFMIERDEFDILTFKKPKLLLLKNWKMLAGGRAVSDLPRYVALRDGVFSHLAHHRGQLTVYLRLNSAAVPALYGPSADERGF